MQVRVSEDDVMKHRHHILNRQTGDHCPLFILWRTNDSADVLTDEQNQVIILKQITKTVTQQQGKRGMTVSVKQFMISDI